QPFPVPPPVPEFAVRRDRLLALLDLAVQRRVTVVVAPPGYGKTVLVSQWAAAHPRTRVRWLALDPEHDDIACFAHDLGRSLAEPSPGSDEADARARLDGARGEQAPRLLAAAHAA